MFEFVRQRIVAIKPRFDAGTAPQREIEIELVHRAAAGTGAYRGFVRDVVLAADGEHLFDARSAIQKLAQLRGAERLLAARAHRAARLRYAGKWYVSRLECPHVRLEEGNAP